MTTTTIDHDAALDDPLSEQSIIDLSVDALLDAAVLEGALSAGRHPRLTVHQFGAARTLHAGRDTEPGTANPQADRWPAADLAFLAEWAGILGDADIAARLGRSTWAVRVKRIRAGLPGPTKHPDYLTAQQAARALGVDVKSICELIERGLLAAELAPLADRKVWRIRRATFTAWALRPESWVYFYRSVRHPARIRDEKLRRLIGKRAAAWGDAWWTTEEVAAHHGVHHKDVLRYIYAGKVAAVRWSNWMVRRSEATRPSLRFFKGRGEAQLARHGTPAGDAFLVLAVAVGIPWTHVERLMGRATTGAIQLRWASMLRRGYVPWLIRAFGLPVRYRAADGAVWADWREHAGRFPVVARAHARFTAGEPLTKQERFALGGALRAAVVWERGADDPLARRLTNAGVPGAAVLREGLAVYERLSDLQEK